MRRVNPLRRRRYEAHRVVLGLWVGSAPDRWTAQLLHERESIDAVVDLRAERPVECGAIWPPGVESHVAPLPDHGTPTQGQLGGAAQMVVELMRDGREVLVHCHAGFERAPMVACAALVLSGWRLSEAFRQVTTARPAAMPTQGQLTALQEYAEAQVR